MNQQAPAWQDSKILRLIAVKWVIQNSVLACTIRKVIAFRLQMPYEPGFMCAAITNIFFRVRCGKLAVVKQRKVYIYYISTWDRQHVFFIVDIVDKILPFLSGMI